MSTKQGQLYDFGSAIARYQPRPSNRDGYLTFIVPLDTAEGVEQTARVLTIYMSDDELEAFSGWLSSKLLAKALA